MAKLCPGPSARWEGHRLRGTFQAAEHPVEASSGGGTALCEGEEMIPFPHYMVVSVYIILLSAEKHLASQKLQCTQGNLWSSLGSSAWVLSAFPGRPPEPHRAELPPQPLLGSPQSPVWGAPPLPLPWRCGKWHQK